MSLLRSRFEKRSALALLGVVVTALVGTANCAYSSGSPDWQPLPGG